MLPKRCHKEVKTPSNTVSRPFVSGKSLFPPTFHMLSHFSHVADTLFSVRILSVLSVKSDVFKIFSIKIVSEGSSSYDIFRHYIHQCQSGIDIISLNTDLSIEISPCAALIVASMIISGSHLLKSMSKPAFLIRSVINNLSVRPFPSRNG